jgi:hypothetical protein
MKIEITTNELKELICSKKLKSKIINKKTDIKHTLNSYEFENEFYYKAEDVKKILKISSFNFVNLDKIDKIIILNEWVYLADYAKLIPEFSHLSKESQSRFVKNEIIDYCTKKRFFYELKTGTNNRRQILVHK